MKSRAIVLHTLKYSDEALIVDLLTPKSGCVSMMVRVSRSKRAAVRHTLFQPLAILEVEWTERPKANLQRPTAAQSAFPFSSLPYDPYKSAMALFLSEFLHHAVRTQPDAESVFEFVCRSIEWLDTCEKNFSNFHLVFLLRLTRFLGFMPNMEGYINGDYFDLRSSCFTPSQPLHPDFLSPEDAALVPKLMRMKYATMRVFRFSGAERSRLLEELNKYYQLHLPNFPELKSLAVLKQIF